MYLHIRRGLKSYKLQSLRIKIKSMLRYKRIEVCEYLLLFNEETSSVSRKACKTLQITSSKLYQKSNLYLSFKQSSNNHSVTIR